MPRIIYIKNPSQGSNFRTLGGRSIDTRTGSGSKKRSPYPQLPQFPKFTTVTPGAYIAPVSPAIEKARKSLGFGNISDWAQGAQAAHIPQFAVLNTLVGWNPTSWTEFLFEDTLIEGIIPIINNSPTLKGAAEGALWGTPKKKSDTHFIGTINDGGQIIRTP